MTVRKVTFSHCKNIYHAMYFNEKIKALQYEIYGKDLDGAFLPGMEEKEECPTM
jgi:hypothetical protein